jgi:lipopolysaccharide transport system ATP-binding protein
MSDVVIRVEHLSKCYQLGVISHGTLRRDLQSWWARVRGKPDPNAKIGHTAHHIGKDGEHFWALQDVSFDVRQGQIIGIIGRNGAGKSTLLKILSKITQPTDGCVKLKGRVGSLLEVGTGFHGELTGRENTYLNGAILGMRKAEIDRKFDEIVDFADIEEFIDTPVKRYSSGMYVRLAFAVAAHLEPEILLVDEVLAVGDIRFQRKCLGKMRSVSQEGRTVLFVSHNMPTITSLCQECLLLDAGRLVKRGVTSEVVMQYYGSGESSPAEVNFLNTSQYFGDDYARLTAGAILNHQQQNIPEILIDEPFTISMRYQILSPRAIKCFPNFHLYNADGVCVCVLSNQQTEILPEGEYLAQCTFPGTLLNEGSYFVGLALSSVEKGVTVHFYAQNCLGFTIKDPIEGTKTRQHSYSGPIPGVIRPDLAWRIERTV